MSAASGEYLADAGGSTDYGDVGGLPPPASYETHRQQALGLDAEYPLGHVVVRGEVVASRWDVPFQNGDPTLELDALGTSLETRVALTPRWSMSVRGDRLGFSRMARRTASSAPGTPTSSASKARSATWCGATCG